MKKTVLALLLVSGLSVPDLQFGTGSVGFGCGSNSPAAQRPFSFVRLGPDTTPLIGKNWQFQHYGGYSSVDHAINVFSHMHLVGAGVIDLGVLGVLPAPSSLHPPTIKRTVLFKNTEVAKPGYYEVIIGDNIKCRFTTTQRCGLHHYSSPHSFDLQILPTWLLNSKATRNATITLGQNSIQGSIFFSGSFGGRFGGVKIHFHLTWHTPATVKLFQNTSFVEGNTVNGSWVGAVLSFPQKQIEIAVGLSYVSVENARDNLLKEVASMRFDEVQMLSETVWKEELARFDVVGISQRQQSMLQSAIYRTLQSPTVFNDHNGEYMSFSNDGKVLKVPEGVTNIYTDLSLWDVHRTQLPWLMLHDERRAFDVAMTLLQVNREGGYMPKWTFANGWTGCMIAAHANTVLAQWLLKQPAARLLAPETLEYMKRDANGSTPHDRRPDPSTYLKFGFLPADNSKSACSQTLQLSTNDFAISKVAALLNDTASESDFLNRSKFYRNLWNPKTRFFEPRFANGSFMELNAFDRLNIFSPHYVEGNAWHYRFVVPQDVEGLTDLFGGKETLLRELHKFFTRSRLWKSTWLPNPYYWAGNEHDLFAVWLFALLGDQQSTQKYSRQVLETSYNPSATGLPGNDDYGTMSAWLIFASLGLYPHTATSKYVLGSPTVHSARLLRRRLDNSLVALNIRSQNNGLKRYRVWKTVLNGVELLTEVEHQALIQSNAQLIFMFE